MVVDKNTPSPEGRYLQAAGNSFAGDRSPVRFIKKATKHFPAGK